MWALLEAFALSKCPDTFPLFTKIDVNGDNEACWHVCVAKADDANFAAVVEGLMLRKTTMTTTAYYCYCCCGAMDVPVALAAASAAPAPAAPATVSNDAVLLGGVLLSILLFAATAASLALLDVLACLLLSSLHVLILIFSVRCTAMRECINRGSSKPSTRTSRRNNFFSLVLILDLHP